MHAALPLLVSSYSSIVNSLFRRYRRKAYESQVLVGQLTNNLQKEKERG